MATGKELEGKTASGTTNRGAMFANRREFLGMGAMAGVGAMMAHGEPAPAAKSAATAQGSSL